MECGIYVWENVETGECYVGQTKRRFSLRKSEHRGSLRANKHPNDLLQRAWNRYGEGAFRFKILRRAKRNLDRLETYWIIRLNAAYNETWPPGRSPIYRDAWGNIIPPNVQTAPARSRRQQGNDDGLWGGWAVMVGAIVACSGITPPGKTIDFTVPLTTFEQIINE